MTDRQSSRIGQLESNLRMVESELRIQKEIWAMSDDNSDYTTNKIAEFEQKKSEIESKLAILREMRD